MKPEIEYVKGFNSGYTIRKHHPLLMKNLVAGAKGNSKYLEGLKAGGTQFEKEMQAKLKNFNQERSGGKKEKDQGLEI